MYSTVGVSHSQQARTKTAKKRWIFGCCGGVWNWTRNIFTLSWCWLEKKEYECDCRLFSRKSSSLYTTYVLEYERRHCLVIDSLLHFSVLFCFSFYICCTTCLFILGYAYCIITIVTSSCFDSTWLSRSPLFIFVICNVSQKISSSSSCFFCVMRFWLDTLFDFFDFTASCGCLAVFLIKRDDTFTYRR